MMKKNRKVIISLTSLSLCMGALCLLPVHALEDSTEKEEVVYANLKHNGSLDQCYVVNIMYPENDTIVDYGNYSSIKNLTTEDKLDFQNNKIKGTTSENELYYQGYLKNTEIPWDIDISYYLNDKEISAKKLAGASGQLKIKMNIQENKKSKDEFFDNYALQASVTLDTNLCRNITAKDATIANVGSDKQLTYTILPGKSKDIEITADVVDFSMDSIAINGVRLNLGIDTDSIDTQTLDEQINEIQTAVQELNDEDNGNRRFILCTNNENNICEDVTYRRLIKVNYGTPKTIPHKFNLKYYRCTYIPRINTENENLHNNLLINIRNLIQLENGIEIDDNKIRIYIDENELDKFSKNQNELDMCEKIYISSDILLTSKQESIFENNNIKLYIIPEYYFEDEIMEVM